MVLRLRSVVSLRTIDRSLTSPPTNDIAPEGHHADELYSAKPPFGVVEPPAPCGSDFRLRLKIGFGGQARGQPQTPLRFVLKVTLS